MLQEILLDRNSTRLTLDFRYFRLRTFSRNRELSISWLSPNNQSLLSTWMMSHISYIQKHSLTDIFSPFPWHIFSFPQRLLPGTHFPAFIILLSWVKFIPYSWDILGMYCVYDQCISSFSWIITSNYLQLRLLQQGLDC